jgi:hypothetical protein
MKWILAAVLVLTAAACEPMSSGPEPFCVEAAPTLAECERGYFSACTGGWDVDANRATADWTGPNCTNGSPSCGAGGPNPYCVRDPRINLDGDAGL